MLKIYRASAGAGKTYTLAYQYIKMLLGSQIADGSGDYRLNTRRRNRHRSILAITFTNKATEEMKQRIIHELAVLAGNEPGWDRPSPYLGRLAEELHAPPETIREEAGRALEEILFDYGSFAVSTIDSFFQQVLRTFAREADLTGNYELDLDSNSMLRMAIARMFRSVDYPDDREAARRTEAWLGRFLSRLLADGKSVELFNRDSYLFGSLLNFASKALNETFARHEAEMTAFLERPDALPALATALEAALDAASSPLAPACAAAFRALEAAGQGSDNALKILRWFADPEQEWKDNNTIAKMADEPESALRKGSRKAERENYALLTADTALMDALSAAGRAYAECRAVRGAVRPLLDNIYFLGLLSDILRQLELIRRENNTLLLSDTNGLLNRIIGDADTPFIYERMGVWLEHFLIDEFQDTSRMQWDNMRPLIREELSQGLDSLIIGDEKQSIYRFRAADPTLLQTRVADDLHGLTDDRSAALNTNWRSSATVVEFNNEFFASAASNPGAGALAAAVYGNVLQNVSPAHNRRAGYVAINRSEAPRAAEAEAEGFRLMAEAIGRQLGEGGYRPADIAILARGRRQAVAAIDYLLNCQDHKEGFPPLPRFDIISDDSIAVGSSRAVKLVMSALKAIILQRPSEEAAEAAGERRAHSRNLGNDILARLVNDFEFHRHSGAEPSQALALAVEAATGSDERAAALHAPGIDTEMTCPNLPSLVDRFIAALVDPASLEREHLFIAALQDLVADYTARNGSDIAGFVAWWDSKGSSSSVAVPETASSMRVMTIHKAKGLEFRCVHIPVGSWKLADFKSPEWFDIPAEGIPGLPPEAGMPPLFPMVPSPSLADTVFGPQYEQRVNESKLDELNSLYVAFTRPVDELVVTYHLPPGKESPGKSGVASTGELIYAALASMGSESGSYTAGSPTQAGERTAGRRTALAPQGEIAVAPVAPADSPEVWERTRLDSRRADPLSDIGRGVMLHDVLSEVSTRADLPRAVRRMTARGVVPAAMAAEVEALLEQALSHPEVTPWFEGFRRVITERTIAAGCGSDADNRRPDRVVWTADGHIDVIDYKTGEENHRAHTRQVQGYMARLRSLGHTRVRGYVWYIDPFKIVTVSS